MEVDLTDGKGGGAGGEGGEAADVDLSRHTNPLGSILYVSPVRARAGVRVRVSVRIRVRVRVS